MKKLSYKFAWMFAFLPIAVTLQIVGRFHPRGVEMIYSRQIYPVLSGIFGYLFGLLPFCAAEALLALLVLFMLTWIILGIVCFRINRWWGLLHAAVKVLAVLCLVGFLIVSMWGLNYDRRPLAENLGYDGSTPTKTELQSLMNEEITQINTLCPQITYKTTGQSVYTDGFARMCSQANAGFSWYNASVQPSQRIMGLGTAYPKAVFPRNSLIKIGIEGIFIPFTYEPTVDAGLPDFVLAFNITHETAHFKGFAREDEANFMAYLACRSNPDVYFQYAGSMNAFCYVSNALYATDQNAWKQEVKKLDRRAARDVDYYNSYLKKQVTGLQKASNKINDVYLKAQGENQGIVSYDLFVDLLAGQYRSTHANK